MVASGGDIATGVAVGEACRTGGFGFATAAAGVGTGVGGDSALAFAGV